MMMMLRLVLLMLLMVMLRLLQVLGAGAPCVQGECVRVVQGCAAGGWVVGLRHEPQHPLGVCVRVEVRVRCIP